MVMQKFHAGATSPPVRPSMHCAAPKSCPGKSALESVVLIDALSAVIVGARGAVGDGGGGDATGQQLSCIFEA